MMSERLLLSCSVSEATCKVERLYAAHTVPDHHRLRELKALARPYQIVGEDLHSAVLVRLVAPSVPPQVHRHYAVASVREVLY
jgi:hypothetical protein